MSSLPVTSKHDVVSQVPDNSFITDGSSQQQDDLVHCKFKNIFFVIF